MSTSAWGLLALFLVVLLALAWPLGIWLSRIGTGRLPQWMLQLEAPPWSDGSLENSPSVASPSRRQARKFPSIYLPSLHRHYGPTRPVANQQGT